MDTVGIGMIGSGFMGLTYSEAISQHVKGARLVAVTCGKRAPKLAADYGVSVEPSLEALLSRPDIHAVVLATPDQAHRAETLLAAKAGKHVLVEKPMAPSIAQCQDMIAACRTANVNLAVVQTERYRQLTRRAKQLIEDGTIGQIRMMRTVSMFPETVGRELLTTRPWLAEPSGGGLFFNIASHNTDFLLWLNGSPVTKVFATSNTYSDLRAPYQSLMAQFLFANGVMAHMWISSEVPPPSLPSSEVRFTVVGSTASLDFENFEYLDLGKGEKWERVFTPQRFDYFKEPKSPIRLEPHIGVVQEFVDSIREKRRPKVAGEEGRANIEICEACLISARTGQAVDLPLR
jgi:predicted dehydrogenase